MQTKVGSYSTIVDLTWPSSTPTSLSCHPHRKDVSDPATGSTEEGTKKFFPVGEVIFTPVFEDEDKIAYMRCIDVSGILQWPFVLLATSPCRGMKRS